MQQELKAPNTMPQSELKAPHRRLVLMFDGTWDKRSSLTNVARMFEAIDDSVIVPPGQPVQLVNYLAGVGTGVVGHLSGGILGYGLSKIVEAGYTWLSETYKEGDEIFVFGFSRGAYSARSLVSLVHKCEGVLMLKPDSHAAADAAADAAIDTEKADEEMKQGVKERAQKRAKELNKVVGEAYATYRAYAETTDDKGVEKSDKSKSIRTYMETLKTFGDSLTSGNYKTQKVTVKMLGVWDTVGALGTPDTHFEFFDDWNKYSNKHYGFHDQGLPCIVEHAYHALAIDEHRWKFAPTLWDKQPQVGNKEVKQVWFIGSHSNVGGGAGMDGNNPDDLWLYSYVWMQENARRLGLQFYWLYNSAGGTQRRVSRTKVEDSYAHFMQIPVIKFEVNRRFRDRFYRNVDGSNGAKLHWSVKERIQQDEKYRPVNLIGTDALQKILIVSKHEGSSINDATLKSLTDDRTLELSFDVSCYSEGPDELIEIQFKIHGETYKSTWQIEDEERWQIEDEKKRQIEDGLNEAVESSKSGGLRRLEKVDCRSCKSRQADLKKAASIPGSSWRLWGFGA